MKTTLAIWAAKAVVLVGAVALELTGHASTGLLQLASAALVALGISNAGQLVSAATSAAGALGPPPAGKSGGQP